VRNLLRDIVLIQIITVIKELVIMWVNYSVFCYNCRPKCMKYNRTVKGIIYLKNLDTGNVKIVLMGVGNVKSIILIIVIFILILYDEIVKT